MISEEKVVIPVVEILMNSQQIGRHGIYQIFILLIHLSISFFFFTNESDDFLMGDKWSFHPFNVILQSLYGHRNVQI